MDTNLSAERITGRYDRYPDMTGKRLAEGGRRLSGKTTQSISDVPLVSVVTVCWNAEKTIEQTIKSIAAQTYQNIEYIIVDGASTDSTLDVVRTHETDLDYFVSEPDGGIYDAMNKGLELASGDYIIFLNSDDWYEPDAISRLVAAHEFSGCDFTGSLARYVRDDGGSSVLPSMTYDKSVLLRMPIRHETMLIPAELYERVGRYDTRFPIIADFDFTVRLYQTGATYYEVNAPLLNFRTSGVSNTALDQLHAEHRALLARVFPFLSENELLLLGDHSKARPDDFIDVANRHLDQSDFVLAVRSMLRDFERLWGGPWANPALERLAPLAPLRYPKISIVIPMFNAADFIETQIQRVLMQGLDEIEVICVDDCSTDQTVEIVKSIAERSSRVKLIRNERNRGPGGSRNAGIRAAKGKYVFFLDADDELPSDALVKLFSKAEATKSCIVRGAYRVERQIHGEMKNETKYAAGAANRSHENVSLSDLPELLDTTEGHWAGLYQRDFVETVLYPENLRMGEDSLFLINALSRARSVSIIPDVVYIYKDNSQSAMNNFDFSKYLQDVQWRQRSWGILTDNGFKDRADFILFDYWHPQYFHTLDRVLSVEERREFFEKLLNAFRTAGSISSSGCKDRKLREILANNFLYFDLLLPTEKPIEVAVLTTSAQGGAGIASQRSMLALRNDGAGAFSVCIFTNDALPHVFEAPLEPASNEIKTSGNEALWHHWHDTVVVDGAKARELFSGIETIVDAEELGRSLASVDLIHLHWVTGMIDFNNIEALFADHPVVWTLHDMNPFTGGCHYSEGCEGYKNECQNCPLLPVGSQIAHDNWKAKREAYRKIETMHIVCPSQWIADCAAQSSLFAGREIHVVPNIFPVSDFTPTDKLVARLKLGLAPNKKYVVFGADNLENQRKGGQILHESLKKLKEMGQAENVEGLFFGSSHLQTAIPSHNLGFISDPKQLSLIYAAADAFAFPSLEDNAPQTVVEALLSGTPVVAFPVGNVSELVDHRDTGYLARYGEVDDFTSGLMWALKDDRSTEAKFRGLRGHIHVRNYHDSDRSTAQVIELYREILSNAPEEPI